MPAVTTAFGVSHRESDTPPPAGDFGYDDGDMLYPVQDWCVKNTFLDIPEPPSLSLSGFFKDREICSCPPRTAHLGGIMTAILDDASEDEVCCPEAAEEAEREDSNCRSDLKGRESILPAEVLDDVQQGVSQLLACTEHQAAALGSSTCNATWAQLLSLAQPAHQMNQRPPWLEGDGVVCVTPMQAQPQQACHTSPHQMLCLSEALPAPALAQLLSAGLLCASECGMVSNTCNASEQPLAAATVSALPSLGSAGHHLGQCQPCAFTAKGCSAGESCTFCHLCDSSEHKRQKKRKQALRRAAVWAQKAAEWAHERMLTAEQEVEPGKRGSRARRAGATTAGLPAQEFDSQGSRARGRQATVA